MIVATEKFGQKGSHQKYLKKGGGNILKARGGFVRIV